MLALGLTLSVADFRQSLSQLKLLSVGLACQLLLLPLIGLLLIIVFKLEGEIALGLLIICLAPGGATSNMLSHLSGGDTSLSVLLTTFSSLITPLSLPLFVLFGSDFFLADTQSIHFPFLRSVGQLLAISVLPIVLGMLWHRLHPQSAKKAYRGLRQFSILGLFLLASVMMAVQWGVFSDIVSQLWLPCLMLFGVAFSAGFWLSRGSGGKPNQQITLGFETGIQNAGTAIFVGSVLLASPIVASVALLYGVLMQIPATALMFWFMRQAGQRPYSSSPL